MTKFFHKFKKLCFWPNVGDKKIFPGKSGSVPHNFTTSHNILGTNNTIPTPRQVERWTEG